MQQVNHQENTKKIKLALFSGVLIISSLDNIYVGACFMALGLFYIALLSLAILYNGRRKWKHCLRTYLASKTINLFRSPITLAVSVFILNLNINTHMLTYLALMIDITTSLITANLNIKHLTPITIRKMHVGDIDKLIEIENETFNITQKASTDQIIKRIATNGGTCLVAEHMELGVVGSLYLTSGIKEHMVREKMNSKQIQNNDDFSKSCADDSLYIVGLQTKKVRGLSVALYLEAECIKYAMMKGYRGILRGPRLLEYDRHAPMDLNQFIRSDDARLLKNFIRNVAIPFISRPEIISGLQNYPDPKSLNCAALVWLPTPFYRAPKKIRQYFASVVYVLALTQGRQRGR